MVMNTLQKSVISGVRKVHLLLVHTSSSQSSITVCTNTGWGYNISKLYGNINALSPVQIFPCKHSNFSHQTSFSSWISMKSGVCWKLIRNNQKFTPQRFSQVVGYCKNIRKEIFSNYFYVLRPKYWFCGKVRLKKIIFGSIFVVPPIVVSKEDEKILITEVPKEPKKKKRGILFELLLSVCEVLQLCLRALRLILTFGPILVLYPVTYFGKSATDIWWILMLKAIEFSGPILIKLGQWASTRRDIFPDACCSQFSRLQRRIKPHSWPYTLYQLRKAFGPNWKKIFIKFDNDGNPIGSGCVAQVYKVWMSTEAIPDDALVEEILSDMDDDTPSLYEGLEVMGFGRIFNLENAMEWDQVHSLKEWRELRDQRKAQERKEELEGEKELQLAEQSVTEVERLGESAEDSATEEQPLLSLVEEWQEGDHDKSLPVDEAPPEDLEGLVPVAIKVLHPGVQSAFRRDLQIMRACAWFLTVIFPSLEWLSLPQCVDEFAEVMAAQIDLKTEAKHLEKFSENFADVPFIKFPRPLRPYVTKKVLVETYEEGEPMINFIRSSGDDAPDELKKRLAEIGVDALLKMGESVADLFLNNSEHKCKDPEAFKAEITELVQTARHNTISLGQVLFTVGVLFI
ncbi:uncharacterized aarF domain-containing protein kinase 2-like isoform X2 [Panulirus ornatus]|uniref:uncharacterized aarF domain-containing protein kinase 2-like isoform X2 n=1 Tax=Panulirus ornatus TaxID=150431 RepID=UPI003A864D0C